MDRDCLVYAILMGVFGVIGITATAHASPNMLTASSCNCIPSPAVRFQELSVILLAFAAILGPIGLIRTPIVGAGMARAQSATPSGLSMKSGEFFVLGISLVVIGVATAVPSFLVLKNWVLIGEGAVLVVFGLFLSYRGGRSA